ncbi:MULTISPECIES: HAD hydrolase family protein [Bacteroidaceae]|jgi:hydroxymethylpyrimidine pyrophosphatase-like HAD family hydrolase|uniref:HAD family hydrolase n=1 Tax=Bacteroidaceae TaxID=815 RepID=UPI0025F31FA5|nr:MULTISPECIES: HAD hydrolase family protein [Bacteroidaceae]
MKSVRPSYIRKADIGVVMENTNDSLKAVADYITASVDDDGVYCALKKWVFDAAE